MKSILLINGNDPKSILNSTLYGADAVSFDLYSMVPAENKDAARFLVQEAMGFFDFGKTDILVRVNPLGSGLEDDLAAICQAKPKTIILPMADSHSVPKCDELLSSLEKKFGLPAGAVKIIPQIDSVSAIQNISEVLVSSPRVCGAVFGAKTILKEMGVEEVDGSQLLYARSRLVFACISLKLPAFDRSWLDIKNVAGFENDVKQGHSLGFTGKVAAAGNQVAAINRIYA